MNKSLPLGLYIHFPWCVKKCPYCDFNSHPLRGDIPASDYAGRLLEDLAGHGEDIAGRKIQSVFLGGGTPSLFPLQELESVIDHLFGQDMLAADCEITLEANPGTIERGRFMDYQRMGINRISLGVQSLQNEKLKALGRIHSSDDVRAAVDEIFAAGIENFNIDLMHGLPDQSVNDALYDLKEAMDLNPTHLSWYQLTLEPHTLFAARPPKLPDETLLFEIEEEGKALIAASGFTQYEVSAYARSASLQSRHNLNYWRFGDYIGIGAGAHGKVTDASGKIIRHAKHKHPKLYLGGRHLMQSQRQVVIDELPYEFMLNALRLNDGFEIELFEKRTGLAYATIQQDIDKAVAKQLIEVQNSRIYPTALGRRFLNDIINLF
ncbi:MAG: radical SAM family heme chaperone HemW [Francisellaceae bacterium]